MLIDSSYPYGYTLYDSLLLYIYVMFSYDYDYKLSSKPVMKSGRVETIEAARKEYAELFKEGWVKTSIFRSYF